MDATVLGRRLLLGRGGDRRLQPARHSEGAQHRREPTGRLQLAERPLRRPHALGRGDRNAQPVPPPQDQVAVYMAKYREPLGHWGMDPAATVREFSPAIRIRPTRIRVF